MPVRPLTGIILASGMGRRLREVTGELPKCLYPLPNNTILIDYPLSAMLKARVRRIIITVPAGHAQSMASRYSSLPAKLEVIENREVQRGNAYSLLISLEVLGEPWAFVACCDTIFTHRFLSRLSESATGEEDAIVAVSESSSHINYQEASKVLVDASWNVRAIGKHLKGTHYIDTGVFLVAKRLARIREMLDFSRETHLYEMFNSAVKGRFRVRAVNTKLEPWTEVDSREDLESLLYGERRRVLEHFMEETGLVGMG